MTRPLELQPFYDGWADQQKNLLQSIGPLTPEQMQLRPAPGEWAIWQLASNMVGGRLYWLCYMLGEDDRGLISRLFGGDSASVNWLGWEDVPERPRNADELVDALTSTWAVIDACINRWSLDDLQLEVTSTDAWGTQRTITRGWVINRLISHEVHHGSEIALILRVHGLPTAIAL